MGKASGGDMLNVGVVGYGHSGRDFHSYLITLTEGLDLHAVSTRDAERRRAAERERGVKTYSIIDALLEDDKVDLVVIATPHHTHADLSVKAMDAGKHVVTDKVMCMNAAEAETMIAASKRNNVMLSVFQNRRWDWDYSTVKKIIADGLIGDPYYFKAGIMRWMPPKGWRAKKAEGGGILYDWGAHLLDQMFQLVPGKVDRIFCEVQYRGWGSEIGSYGKMLVHFRNGVLFQIEIGNLAMGKTPRWYVLGDAGALVKFGLDPQEEAMMLGNIDNAQEDSESRARIYSELRGVNRELVIDSVRTSWKSYYQNISDVLNEGAELAVKPEEAMRVVEILDAAMGSSETGETVKVDI